jgi:exodeoxyribonuclease VII small subunit
MNKKQNDEPAFEQALEKLEKIVNEMESGELSLEQMTGHFEEGMALVKLCSGKLNEVEKKIEVLVRQGDELKTQPLDEAEDE